MRHYRALMTVLALLLVALVGATVVALVARLELRPVAPGNRAQVVVEVKPGESLDQVVTTLGSDHLVRSTLFFKVLADFKRLGSHLHPGRFLLDPGMGTTEIADILAGVPATQAIRVTIPDGLRAQQEAQLLQGDGLFSASAYMAQIKGGKFPGISPLPGAPAGASWEGMAFGDTFLVDKGISAHHFLELQLQDFNRRIRSLVDRGASAVGLTPYQVVTMASIVSAEASTVKDRGLVAGVFYNRLHDAMPLESDVTILYAEAIAGQSGIAFSTQFPSAYNTYLHPGLTPGPIDSPGLTAIAAALKPTATSYLYFVAMPDGKVLYSVTEAEHLQQVAQAGLG